MACAPGMRFGAWTVLQYAGVIGTGNRAWRCRCECGDERVIAQHKLVSNWTKSCRACASGASVGRDPFPANAVPCKRCGLRGKHECLRGDATRGMNHDVFGRVAW